MEGEVVRRRMKMITTHLVPSDDHLSASHLLPMNCSGSFSSVIRRCDNRMFFARQASASQAFYMRQASAAEQEGCLGGSGAPRKYPNASQAPLFARPQTMKEQNLSSIEAIQSSANVCKSPVLDLPAFARPKQQITRNKQFHCRQDIYSSSESNGIEWSPRMDIEESERNYILTVEAPGVNINDIRVEISDQNLTVMGKRFTPCRSATADSISRYNRREILRGPYRIVWPLPCCVNKAGVSAEFLDGILQIVIPKL